MPTSRRPRGPGRPPPSPTRFRENLQHKPVFLCNRSLVYFDIDTMSEPITTAQLMRSLGLARAEPVDGANTELLTLRATIERAEGRSEKVEGEVDSVKNKLELVKQEQAVAGARAHAPPQSSDSASQPTQSMQLEPRVIHVCGWSPIRPPSAPSSPQVGGQRGP